MWPLVSGRGAASTLPVHLPFLPLQKCSQTIRASPQQWVVAPQAATFSAVPCAH